MSRDIVVTTPRTQMATAAQEAADCIAEGGGLYFRNLGFHTPKDLEVGGRCFYVEDGAVRGFCTVTAVTDRPQMVCDTSGRDFGPGVYVFMDAATWHWIAPLPMSGFQGWRYSTLEEHEIKVLGGWLDSRPEA